MGGYSGERQKDIATDLCGWKTNAKENITNFLGDEDITDNGTLEGLDLVY